MTYYESTFFFKCIQQHQIYTIHYTLRIMLTTRLTTRTIRNKYFTILRNTRVSNPQSGSLTIKKGLT
jgi:hypothetical protein